jgi:uncharacterized repeat protein (TIGR01451 family)
VFPSTHRAPRFLLLVLALLIVGSTSATLLTILPRAEAAIDNNEPSQAFAAYGVDCIRTGADIQSPSERSPRFAATCYGSSWDRESYEFDTPSSTGDAPRTDPAVVGFGDGKPDAPGEPGHVTLASLGTNGTADGGLGLGAVYGLAYSSGRNPNAPAFTQEERTFVGAYTKRITRFGVGGPGAIYVLLPNGDEQVYVTVPDVVNGPNGLPGDPGDGMNTVFPNTNFVSAYSPVMGGIHSLNHDAIGKPLVGRTSLADVELTPDERQLLALNLNNQRIYVYDTWSANPQATQASFALPASTAACPGGDSNFRPFGLHYDGTGNLYVGYVCSAETSQNRSDLRAGVLRVTPTSVWSRVIDFALAPFDAQRTVGAFTYPWQPWSNTFSNEQPILSGIDLTERGDLILGLRDRTGDTGGTELSGEFGVANGDLLIATANGSGGWNAPSSAGAEYFTDQGFNSDYQESLWGSTAYIPGTHDGSFGGEVLSTQGFVYREETGGASWFNTTTGQRTAQEELYRAGPTTLAKAAGLGDVEVLCAWRAIGNRLWNDTNANGVQDAGEPSITGVRMNLIDPTTGAVLSTVTSGGLTDGNDNWRFYIPPWQTYAVRIDPTMFQAGQPLAGLAITTANAGGNDTTDSDADSSGRISIPAGNRGNVDLSFDIGLTQSANILVDKSGPATANAGQAFDYTLTVTNQGPAVAANVQAVDTLPANVSFVSATPAPSSVSGQTLTWNLGSLNAGASRVITLRVQVGGSFSGTLTNQVTVTTTTPGDSPGDNSDTVITTVNAPNLALTKSCPATVAVGQNATFTIGYQNTGSGTFTNVSILDTLPPGFTYISATPAAFAVSGNPYWLLTNLGPGASGTLTVVARAEASAVNTTATNQVALQSATPADSASADNTASCTTQVVGADVSIVKSGPATVLPGGQIAYTLVATNNGPAPATNVVVQDTIPTTIGFAGSTPAQSSIVGQVVTWNLGTLAPGQSVSIQVNAQASAGLAGGTQIVNTATITTSTPGDNPGNNSSTVTTTVIAPNVSVIKDGPTTVVAGDLIQYTLTYGNNGNAAASGVLFSDSLPAGLTFLSSTPTQTGNNGFGAISWDNLGPLNPGQSGTITVVAQVSPTLASGTQLTNRADITTTTPGDNPADNSDTALTTVLRADVRITKSSPTSFPVASGEGVTYALDYTNAGPADAQNVVITDNVPGLLSNVSWSCTSGCAASGTGSSISVNVGSLAVGASGRITVSARANTTLDREDFTNTARIATSTPETDTTNNESRVPGAVWTTDLQIIKDASAQVIAGTTFTATLSYRNNGPAPALAATIADTLPAGVTFVSSVPAPASQAGQLLSWNVGTLADQASSSIAVTLRADAALTQSLSLINRASINTSSPDRNLTNNQDDATTTVIVQADLGITKSGPARVDAGDLIAYNLTYRNDGPSVARSVVVTDTLPVGVTFLSSVPAPTTNVSGTLTWALGDLAPNALDSISILVGSSLTQTQPSIALTNQVVIASPTTPDPDPTNNDDTVTTTVETVDLIVTKTMPATALAGQTVSAVLTLQNAGPAIARSVVFSDTIPAGLTYASATPAPTSVSGQVVTWNVGNMAANANLSFGMVLRSAANTPDGSRFTNTAEATTRSVDRDLTNNQASAITQINREADLRISKTASSPGPLLSGAVVTYTLTFRNDGPSVASSVVVTDTLPPGFAFTSASPAPTTNVSGTLTWALGDLAPSTGGTLRVSGVLTTSQPSEVKTNTATIGSPTTDPTPGNNSSTVTTEVQTADVSVVKTANPGTVYAGATITYTLLISNAGPATAQNVVLTDTLPAGVTFVSASPTATPNAGGVLTWNVGTLANGQSRTYTVVVTVNPSLPAGSLINRAAGQTTAPDRDPTNNQDDATTPVVVPQPDLRVTKTDGVTTAQPGDVLTYTLTVENVGRATARGVVLTEQPPAGATVISTDWTAQTDGRYTYALGTLAVGAQRSATFVIQLPNPFDAATIRNVVQVGDDGSTGPDPTPGDNTDEDEDLVQSGSIGDRIWFDANQDGIQDAGEIGMEGVLVQLRDPHTLAVLATQITGPDGAYRFSGLRMGDYVVQVAPTALQSGPYAGYRITTDPLPATTLTPAQPSDMRLDIGLYAADSTAVTLASLAAQRADDGRVTVRWQTVSESQNAGFRLMRATTPDLAQAARIAYVSSQGSQGGRYTVSDPDAPAEAVYWLVAVEFGGREAVYGPFVPLAPTIQAHHTLYLPLTRR